MAGNYSSSTEMEISSGSRVSWNDTKNKILNSIKERQPSLYINTLKILDQIEREYSLSGTNQSIEALYYNSVSGILHSINRRINPLSETSADKDRWPDSSMFTLKIGNKIVLIGLGGTIEYNIEDIKKYDNNDKYYVNNAKVTFFNGSQIQKATIHSKGGKEKSSFFSNPSFNNDDIEILSSLGESNINNSYNDFKNNLSFDFTNINYKENGDNRTARYGSDYTIKYPTGTPKIDLSLKNSLNEAEIYKREKQNGKYKLTKLYTGLTRNLVPDGEGKIYIPNIDGNEDTMPVIGNGTNVDSFTTIDNKSNTERAIIEDYASLITSLNYDNQQRADKIDNFCKFLSLLRSDFKPINSPFILGEQACKVFGVTYKELLNINNNGRFCFIFSNESINTAERVQEVIFDDGSIFIGKCNKTENGEVKFITGTFFKNGKKKKITDLTMDQLLNTTLDKKSENITEKDLELFKNTKRLKLVKNGNNYKTLFISKDLTASIEDGKLNQDYKPNKEYLDEYLSSSKEFCISMLSQLASGDSAFKSFAEEIKNNHFSAELFNNITQHIVELYDKARDKGFENKNNIVDKFTFDDINNLYNGIQNLSYLCNIYENIYNKPIYIKDAKELTNELNNLNTQLQLSNTHNKALQKSLQKEKEMSNNLDKKVKELTESQRKAEQELSEAKMNSNKNNSNFNAVGNSNSSAGAVSNSNFNLLNSNAVQSNNNNLNQNFNISNMKSPVTYGELCETSLRLEKEDPETEKDPDIRQSFNNMFHSIVNSNEKQLDGMIGVCSSLKHREPLSYKDSQQITNLLNNIISESGITPGITPEIDKKINTLNTIVKSIQVDPTLKIDKIKEEEYPQVAQDLFSAPKAMSAENDRETALIKSQLYESQIRKSQNLETNNLLDQELNEEEQDKEEQFSQSEEQTNNNIQKQYFIPEMKINQDGFLQQIPLSQSIETANNSLQQDKNSMFIPNIAANKDGFLYASTLPKQSINQSTPTSNLDTIKSVADTIILSDTSK